MGRDPSCWFSLTPSSLVEASEAELLRLALLYGGHPPPRNSAAPPRAGPPNVLVSGPGPPHSSWRAPPPPTPTQSVTLIMMGLLGGWVNSRLCSMAGNGPYSRGPTW